MRMLYYNKKKVTEIRSFGSVKYTRHGQEANYIHLANWPSTIDLL
jgi:hypothetical protein